MARPWEVRRNASGNKSSTFSLDLAKFAAKTKGKFDAVVRKVVIDVGTKIIQRSPVDTGRFRANWQYGESVRPSGLVAKVDQSGQVTITTIVSGIKAEASGKIHWLVNNLPYGIPLEYGHSKQAPHGMIGITLTEYESILRDAAQAEAAK